MTRPGFIVITKDGNRYGADQLSSCLRQYDLKPMISFICSGQLITKDADQVQEIKYQEGLPYCPYCDESMVNKSGEANPSGFIGVTYDRP